MKKSFFISLVIHIFLFGSLYYFLEKYTFFNEEVRVIKISSIKTEKKDFCKCKSIRSYQRRVKKEIKKSEIKEKKKVLKKKKLVKKDKTLKKKVRKIGPKQIKKTKHLLKKAPKKKTTDQKEITKEVKEIEKKKNEKTESKKVEKSVGKEKKVFKNLLKSEKNSIKKEEDSFQEFIFKIKKAIEENKKYPKIAKRLRKQGIVEIEFVITANGNLKDLKVIKSSHHKILDKSAIKTIKKASLYFPKPVKDIKIKVPIEYILTPNKSIPN